MTFFSFKLSLYRCGFRFPKNQIQNKRNYQVLSGTVEPRYNEGPRDWQNLFAITRFCYIEVLFHIFYYYRGKENRSLYRGLRYLEVRYIEVLFHTFYYYWGKENRSLYRGLRYIEVRYIEVLFHIFYYYWSKENRSLYRELRYIEVRYIEVLFHTFYYYWGKENRSLY